MARSWMARPVESNRVISSSDVRPGASPARTAPYRHVLPREHASSTAGRSRRCGSPAPSRRRRRACGRAPTSPPLPCPARPLPSRRRAARAGACLCRSPARAGGHRHDEICRERVFERRGDVRSELARRGSARASIRVVDRHRSAARDKGASCRAAVHPHADDGCGRGVRAADRLGREHGGGARPQPRHRSRVEDRDELTVLRIREQNEPTCRRQALAPGCPGTTSPT